VNTTDSAVRITHKPTGLVVSMQDEKSQLQNRERALRVLRARLYEHALHEQQAELAADRRAQVGTGERSEKVRTYNFPQGRITDHRIKLTSHNLEGVLDGDLSEFTDALAADEQRASSRPRQPEESGTRALAKATSPLRDAVTEAVETLEAAGVDTPRLDAELLLAAVLGVDRAALYADPQAGLDMDAALSFDDMLRRRAARAVA
jgi:hypothetical protein